MKKKKKAKSHSLQLTCCGEPRPVTAGKSPCLTGTLLAVRIVTRTLLTQSALSLLFIKSLFCELELADGERTVTGSRQRTLSRISQSSTGKMDANNHIS